VASLGTWSGPARGSAGDAEPFAAAVFEATTLEAAAFEAAVRATWDRERRPIDPTGLVAEANAFRYRPLRRVLLRVGSGVASGEVALALAAARAVGVSVTLSTTEPLPEVAKAGTVEADDALEARLDGLTVDKIRFLGPIADRSRLAAIDAGLWVDDLAVMR